jgi:hypothetical protein
MTKHARKGATGLFLLLNKYKHRFIALFRWANFCTPPLKLNVVRREGNTLRDRHRFSTHEHEARPVLSDGLDQSISSLYFQLKQVHRVATYSFNKYAEYKYLGLQVNEVG